jgi:hypothetical protein
MAAPFDFVEWGLALQQEESHSAQDDDHPDHRPGQQLDEAVPLPAVLL